ncbi:MAG: hypothetical protein KC503_30155 [Myxococcales bacterium]|nr:hypothetical protein [Myxococcales bacterium]
MDEGQGTEARIEALERRLEALEERLSAIEQGAPSALAIATSSARAGASATRADAAQQVAEDEPATPRSGAHVHRVAVASFALVGALMLRTMTRQHLLDAELGTALGLFYCALLLVGPSVVERVRGSWAHARMLQISGTLLAPIILVEMVGRHHALSLSFAALAIGVAAAAATLLAWLRSSAGLAATLVALVFGLAALGLKPEAAAARAAVLVELAAAALWLAHTRGWFVLRAFVLLPASALLSAALIYSARRAELVGGVPLLAGAQLAILALLLASNALRSEQLERLERVLAPLLALWTYLLMVFLAPDIAVPLTAALAGLLLLAATLVPAERSWSAGAAGSSLLLGALLAVVSFPLLDRSGLALGASALAAQFLAARRAVSGATALAQLLALSAAATCVVRGGLLRGPAGGGSLSVVWIGLGLALVVLLLASYALGLSSRDDDARARRERALSWAFAPALSSAAVVAYGTLQQAASLLSADARFVSLSRSVIIALLSVATLWLGRARRLAVLAYLGVAGMLVLLVKVALLDLMRLEGGYVVAAVLTLGFAATATSIVLKRTPSPTSDPPEVDEAK